MAAIKYTQGLMLLVIALVLAGCFTFGPRAPGEALDVSSTPWAISTSSAPVQIGGLRFLAGVELKSKDSDFGGYSANRQLQGSGRDPGCIGHTGGDRIYGQHAKQPFPTG